MAAPYLYATLFEFKQRLRVTEYESDEALEAILDSASRMVERLTGHRFYATADTGSATEIRYFTWDYTTNSLALKIDDVLSVTEIATDANGDGTYESVWTTPTDYWLGPQNAVAYSRPFDTINRATFAGRYWFPSYPNAIRVTGNFGASTMATRPTPVRELTLLLAEPQAQSQIGLVMPGIKTYALGQDLRVEADDRAISDLVGQILVLYRDPVYVV